ncbi:glutathione peroxidase [Vagococcus sp. BWB3-3]|uniref:Glutathione peroxidase n=1 Tax=Vagococcus allomyrinae TaxID=2794353 RepID=A0A940P5L2_9ENTE|nr:glutathione peroxidase [Vagococcus allomyrinae]MBP1041827.1 glutathione peroxidase [Vagococcus allomyrinae]
MTIYDIAVNRIDGTSQSLSEFQNKVMLIVNTASKCGFTPQFTGLEALYDKFQTDDLIILGFPCNQFKQQDPDSNQEILTFCQLNYGVTFPMFAKIQVNGPEQAPLYEYLINETNGEDIEWNFAKFLIGKDGQVIQRFAPNVTPEELETEIVKLLN